tara:strand:+ start:3307 stop:3645 length:339 start_codon:yes stop_codon:yes gene_type:complete
MKLWIGISIFIVGQVFGWYQLNLQRFSDWWSDKPLMSAIVLGIPTSIAFWYAWGIIADEMGSVWSARFIGSCTGFIVFPILTWFILGESMFTTKTMICLSLSILIILIQIFY